MTPGDLWLGALIFWLFHQTTGRRLFLWLAWAHGAGAVVVFAIEAMRDYQ